MRGVIKTVKGGLNLENELRCEDKLIIEFYINRSEEAIVQSEAKYGAYCSRIAMNILSDKRDAEECVSDALYAAWERIPPENPNSLRAFLGRITRNLAISKYRKRKAGKRGGVEDILLSELEECVPHGEIGSQCDSVDNEIEGRFLTEKIENWLDTLSEDNSSLFIRRYWYGESVSALGAEIGKSDAQTAQIMYRLRKKLREFLEKEGITV